MKDKRIVSAAIVMSVAAVICIFAFLQRGGKDQTQNELIRYNASFLDVFDTKTDIVGYGTSKEEFTAQVEKLKEKLWEYHKLYDIYNDYEGISNIKTINDNAGIAPVIVDKEIIRLLLCAREMYEQTDGQVNIAMGSVLSIWHEYREQGIADPEHARLPERKELEKAAAYTDINRMIIDEKTSSVYLEDSEMSLDVGGIGKGYAVKQVAEYAKTIGMDNVLISVGGNVCAMGTHTDGSLWKLGIQNPDTESEEEYVQKVDLEDACVVTSGNYQRYYTVDGKRYCHIIDPNTLMPADYFAAVSIIAEDSGEADALSTAVYNMPYEEGLAFINERDGVEAMWIFEDGTIAYSEHFKDYVADTRTQ